MKASLKSNHQHTYKALDYRQKRSKPKLRPRRMVSNSIDASVEFQRFDMAMGRINAIKDTTQHSTIHASDESDERGDGPRTDTAGDWPGPHNSLNTHPKTPSKRTLPSQNDRNLANKWQVVIPTLMGPLVNYYKLSRGYPVTYLKEDLAVGCEHETCRERTYSKVLILYFDHPKEISISHCPCQTLPQVLVSHGLFPTAPSQPRTAISIDFLDFYRALFERACDAVQAMATALHTFYGRRGFHLANQQGEELREPFRRGLGYAFQWLDVLQLRIDSKVEDVIAQADQQLQSAGLIGHPVPQMPMDPTNSNCTPSILDSGPSESMVQPTEPCPNKSKPASPAYPPLPPKPVDRCSRFLSTLCPACFGGKKFGRPLEDGGDIHVCTDGNFNHRHLISGGKGVPFQDPKHIIPKAFVDSVGNHLDYVRNLHPKARPSRVPEEAINACQSSFEAAGRENKKAPDRLSPYDSQGWMSLICRHDIPLFVVNIDTPGEKQKFPIALLIWLYAMLPSHATVTLFYDIGCVLHRSVEIYDILPREWAENIQFVTTAMHAYGHQWACQCVYNPRLKRGIGLTDGEGVERIWSRLTRLIALARSSSFERRAWLTDRLLSALASEMRQGLGDWMKVRMNKGVEEQGAAAERVLAGCEVAIQELRDQWAAQQAAGVVPRRHNAARLKREIDTILSLERELAQLEKTVKSAKGTLSVTSSRSEIVVNDLLDKHGHLQTSVDALYASLNIHELLPDVEEVDPEFIRTLLLAHDLKISIRQRAIGSFFECERLDQAVGGKNPPLGTRLYQQTRKGLEKRQPSLIKAINRYNHHCATLSRLNQASYRIPIPSPLPVKLSDLRKDPSLLDDVWVTQISVADPPRWFTDESVRTGIPALRKLDRCTEEKERLRLEQANMCDWFAREMAAAELSLRQNSGLIIEFALLEHRDRLLRLKTRWSQGSGDINLAYRLTCSVEEARTIVHKLTGIDRSAAHTDTMDMRPLIYAISEDEDEQEDEETLKLDNGLERHLSDIEDESSDALEHTDDSDTD